MKFDDDKLNQVFDKQGGLCHLCGNKICFHMYGRRTPQGWQVDHSKAQARGGTHHLNNLQPAHHDCNNYKGIRPTRSVRLELMGRTTVPNPIRDLVWDEPDYGLTTTNHRDDSPDLAAAAVVLGTTGLGALIGRSIDTENPTRGAFLGGLFALVCAAAATSR